MLEKDIQDQILNFLQYKRGVFVWRQNQSKTVAEYTNKFGESKTRAFRSASVDGISDIIGVYKARPIAIEVKMWPNKPTRDQTIFLESFAEAGGLAMVAYSLEDVIETLAKYNWIHDPNLMFVHWNRVNHQTKARKSSTTPRKY